MKKISLLALLFGLQFSYAQRNVILIIADDLGKDYFTFYPDHENNTVTSTNIQRLLSRGVLFNNAWSNPLCSPTRAGILTGRYSFRTGVGDVVDGSNPKLNINEFTIPKVLNLYSPNGISKACIGKWHVTTFAPSGYSYPNTMGFDHFEGSLNGALGAAGQQANGYYNWNKVTNGSIANCSNYATSENVNNAISYINSQPATKPFFLWLALNAPHTPYQLPPTNLVANTSSLTGIQSDITANPVPYFQSMVEAMDTEIGRLFDYLITTGKWDTTDIIFIGDNGDDPLVAQNTPAKGSVYQGGIAVPMIISGPDIVAPNRTSTALVNTADLFATILELFGDTNWQSQIPTTIVDSKSLVPILLNTSASIRPWAFSEVFRVTPLASDGKTIRNLDYKLIKFDNGTERFFNLTNNPNETSNLLTAGMSQNDIINYNYLCSELNNLVGNGINCNAFENPSFFNSSNEIYIVENPFTNTIQINGISNEDYLEIYSIKGEKIFEGKDISSKDMSYLSSGIYFLKVVNQQKIFKLIKK